MKTEQEQIEAIYNLIISHLFEDTVYSLAEQIYEAGYGDVSEYKAEIERLESENEKLKTKCDDLKKLSDWQREEIRILKAEVNKGCDNCETIKQGQVDVLKELKKYSYTDNDFKDGKWHRYVLVSDIDELIEEIEK